VKSVQIEFEPIGRRGKCSTGGTLLQCAQQLGVGIISICGGRGWCGGCKVQLVDGSCSTLTSIEREKLSLQELQQGYRLACQAYPAGNCKLRVPPESMSSPQRTQVNGKDVPIDLDPSTTAYHLKLAAPSLTDLQGDAERVLEALSQQHQVHCDTIDLDVIRKASSQLRLWNWETKVVVRHEEVIALCQCDSHRLGLAVDLGTTKIAAYLIDLSDGRTLAASGIMNPQISCGEDVITRISYSMESPENHSRIRSLVVEALNNLAGDLCKEAGASPEEIDEAVIVGNTAMHHLFLGLPVEQLARVPFVPALRQAFETKARDVGLNLAPGAYVCLLPNIAGFVGADHVAMILATGLRQANGISLAIDVGTNTEICLAVDGKLTSVSCASGPAFEGGHIKDGMRAANGAIERFQIVNGEVLYQTVDGAAPVGICGSGIIDILAQLYLNGVLDETGRMKDDWSRVRNVDGQREFVIVPEEERGGAAAITITQNDIRELQMAKAAIQVGIRTLLEASGHAEDEIANIIVAGAFGSYIDVANAMAIGMLPSLPLNRFQQVGNAAGVGAKLALLSLQKRAEAQAIAHQAAYIELATDPNFMKNFIDATYLKPYTRKGG
jgi:uncharacterized 2Fe-2S/4Fe-4S cluster protein (DUF4445 family)